MDFLSDSRASSIYLKGSFFHLSQLWNMNLNNLVSGPAHLLMWASLSVVLSSHWKAYSWEGRLSLHWEQLGADIWLCPHIPTLHPFKKKWIFFPHANNFFFMIIAHRILKHLPLGLLMKYCRGCFLTVSQLLLTSPALSGIMCPHLVIWSVIQVQYYFQKFSRIAGTLKMSHLFESGSISLRKPGKLFLT